MRRKQWPQAEELLATLDRRHPRQPDVLALRLAVAAQVGDFRTHQEVCLPWLPPARAGDFIAEDPFSGGRYAMHQQRFLDALHSAAPAHALRALALQLAREGHSKAAIYDFFEQFLLFLRTQENHRSAEEDVVLDVMDALTGWCHAETQLLAEEAST